MLTDLVNSKTRVALFDDNKQRIMTVEWCDDDTWGTESWLTATFYTQSGVPYSRYLWYGDSNLLTGVRLWWDPYTGGKGSIYVRSDVAPYNYLLGACDNASRVVKYVVVMGQGYASNPLVDMRIHDITVVADPNKRLPSVPEQVVADGTLFDQPTLPPQEEWLSKLINWWTGP